MTINEFFETVGGSYDEALGRLMNDKMIIRFEGKFPKDPSFAELTASLESKDVDTAFRNAHTLKGVAQNLCLGNLGKSASRLTDVLRPENRADYSEEKADELFKTVKEDYAAAIDAIAQL